MGRSNNKKNRLGQKFIREVELKSDRKAGVLLPVSALNGDEGIGDFGDAAFEFVDILSEIGFEIWQILPLNPLGYGNSPYQPYSSFAGDEIYISLEKLKRINLIKSDIPKIPQDKKVDFIKVRAFKEKYLREAFKNFEPDDDYKQFIKNEFIYNYAVFMTFRKHNNFAVWNKWSDSMKNWVDDKRLDLTEFKDEINFKLFEQYIFYKQLGELRSYANAKKIEIMGDIPIYVGLDSQDVWQNKKCFLLNKNGNPKFIAGVPPDNFSKTGQRWGNPVYDWEYIQENDFQFWIDRIGYSSELYDILRLDHFRGFETYWKINSRNKTALKGVWVEAPAYDLFEKIIKFFPSLEFVAEDLGDLRQEVFDFRDYFDLKGMTIIQYSFDGRKMTKSKKSKENFDKKNMIVYTGTHDNMTMKSWYEALCPERQKYVMRVLKSEGCLEEKFEDKLTHYTLKHNADYAILPLQDIVGYGDEARINTPGTCNNINWTYKFTSMDELKAKKEFIRNLLKETNRI